MAVERRRRPRGSRRLRRAERVRRLPTRRAVVGSVLVAASAAGVLAAHRSATVAPTERWVVAARELPAGHVLAVEDLGTVAIDLPPGIPAVPEGSAADLVGRVTRSAVAELALVRSGDVLEHGRFDRPGTVEVAVELTPARALSGTVEVGDLVDVLATARDGDVSGTRTVATAARVSAVTGASDDGIGARGTVQVRLGLPDAATATAVVDASVRAELSLVLPAPRARRSEDRR